MATSAPTCLHNAIVYLFSIIGSYKSSLKKMMLFVVVVLCSHIHSVLKRWPLPPSLFPHCFVGNALNPHISQYWFITHHLCRMKQYRKSTVELRFQFNLTWCACSYPRCTFTCTLCWHMFNLETAFGYYIGSLSPQFFRYNYVAPLFAWLTQLFLTCFYRICSPHLYQVPSLTCVSLSFCRASFLPPSPVSLPLFLHRRGLLHVSAALWTTFIHSPLSRTIVIQSSTSNFALLPPPRRNLAISKCGLSLLLFPFSWWEYDILCSWYSPIMADFYWPRRHVYHNHCVEHVGWYKCNYCTWNSKCQISINPCTFP